MVIGTSDGKAYKDELSLYLDRHENLSQESQTADLDVRTPPPLPILPPGPSIAPHNPNPPGGGPYQIKPGERLAQTEIVEDVKTPLPRPDPRKGELGMQDSTPKNPLDPLFDPLLRTQSDVPIQRPREFDRRYRMPSGGYFMDNFLRKKSDEGDVLEQPKFPINKGEPKGRDVPPRRNTPKERLTDASPDPVIAGQQYAGNRIPQTLPGGEGLSIDSENLLHDPNRNKSYDVHNFNTGIAPDLREDFKKWKEKYAPNDHGHDYDLEGAFLQGVKPEKDGHFPDRFKKPNHPTFSEESIYHGADDMYGTGRAAVGGRWEKDGDHWIFHAAESNLKYHSAKELIEYFKKYEPGNKLVLPGQ